MDTSRADTGSSHTMNFGSRASAGFDDEALKEALRYCHLRRKSIYVTVNILVKERELDGVRQTLSLLSHLGADAVLVQDLGVLKICREEFPELPITLRGCGC